MNRRRMMMSSRWASEPLIVYDGSANVKGTLTWQINLNNGFKDKELTNKQWEQYSVYGELRFGSDGAEVYLEDVTRYKKLCMTYRNINSVANESSSAHKEFGVAKDKNYGKAAKNLNGYNDDYDVYAKIPGYGYSGTVELNIENLEGKKMIGFDPKFEFDDGESTGIIVHKIWLE